MDVHRCRFVRYPTSAISTLAFTRSNDSGYAGALPTLRLAIGRANGSIEIWNPQRGLWVQETVFVGNGVSIDGLVWTQDPDETDGDGRAIAGQYRLFSIASSSSVTEWDLGRGLPKRQSTGNFSELWCMSAQPRLGTSKKAGELIPAQDLVAGCGDGTIVLLSTADNDLQFQRFLSRASGSKARCICITYQNQSRVVAGFVDNMIRIYDTKNGSLIRTMSLGIGGPGRPRNTLVWQLRSLSNGDIVSADSAGEVKFWDGKTYSLLQRIESHESDCLDLAVSNDGRTVFSGGIDGKMAVHRISTNAQGRKTWAKTSHRRIHNGEVKAMAAFDSKGMSVVVSGGADVAPTVTPMREYGKENIRSLPSLPQSPPVISAPQARLLVSWWDNDIYIWRFSRLPTPDLPVDEDRLRKLVARITLDTQSSITSVTISHDGRLLAASTENDVRLFQLRKRHNIDALAIRKVQVPEALADIGSRLMQLSPNGKWLAVVSQDNDVLVARVVIDETQPKRLRLLPQVAELDRRYQPARSESAFKDYDRTITKLAFACDSSVLATSDLSGHIDSWILKGEEGVGSATGAGTQQLANGVHRDSDSDSESGSDSESESDSDGSDDDDEDVIFLGQHWIDNPSGHLLPKLDSAPVVLSFRPARSLTANGIPDNTVAPNGQSEQHRLWILTTKHQVLEFDILNGRLSDWSRRNPTSALPEEFEMILGRVVGSVWDVTGSRDRVWLYGHSFVCMLNLGIDFESDCSASFKKRRKPKALDEDNEIFKRRKLQSGAGGKVKDSQLTRVVDRYGEGNWTEVDLERQGESTQESDEKSGELELRFTHVEDGEGEGTTYPEPSSERRYWCTFKYRPILGMVALDDDSAVGTDGPPEVVIVERPHWDVQKEAGSI